MGACMSADDIAIQQIGTTASISAGAQSVNDQDLEAAIGLATTTAD